MSYTGNSFAPTWGNSGSDAEKLLYQKDLWQFDQSKIKKKEQEIYDNHTETNLLKEVDKFVQDDVAINQNFFTLDNDFNLFITHKEPSFFKLETKNDKEKVSRFGDSYWGMNIVKPKEEQLPPGLGLTTPLEQETNLMNRLECVNKQMNTQKLNIPPGLSNPLMNTTDTASGEGNNTVNYVLPSKEELKKKKKMIEEQKNKLNSNNDHNTKDKVTQSMPDKKAGNPSQEKKHIPIVQNQPKTNLANSTPTTKKAPNSVQKQENNQESIPKSSNSKQKNVQPTQDNTTKSVAPKKENKEEAKVNKVDPKREKLLKEIAMNNQFMALQSNHTEFISEPTEPIKELPQEPPVQKKVQPKALSPKNKVTEKPKLEEPAPVTPKLNETKPVETPANNEQAANKKKKKKNKKKKTEEEKASELEKITEESKENKNEIQQIKPSSPKNSQEKIPVIPQNKPVQKEEQKNVQLPVQHAKTVIQLTQQPKSEKDIEGKTGRDIIDEDSDEEESEYVVTSCVEDDMAQNKQEEGGKRLTRTQKKNMKKRNKQKQNKEANEVVPTKTINTTNDIAPEPKLKKIEDYIPADKVEEKPPAKVEPKIEVPKVEENNEFALNDGYEYISDSSYLKITPNYYSGLKVVGVMDLDQSASHE